MHTLSIYSVSAATIISLAVSSPAWSAEDQAGVKEAPVITSETAQPRWADIDGLPPGLQAAFLASSGKWHVARVRFPAHFVALPHSHPNAEAIWVVGGSVGFGFGDKVDMTGPLLKPGAFFAQPGGTPQYVWTGDEGGIVDVLTSEPQTVMFTSQMDNLRQKNQ